MQITISNLPPDIQQQIPISVRLSTDIIDIKDLPISVQYQLNQYLLQQETNTYRPVVIYDATFKYSIYNDLQILDTKRNTIKEYIKNYLMTPRGAYPFDPLYGNRLKYHLQTKDTELRKTLISNELTNLMTLISHNFNSEVQIVSSKILHHGDIEHSEYFLELEISIDGSPLVMTIK